ncbi:hypothetical protein [Gryllotalpicola protaetiae]|uniref:Fis family transcriptional regulator n=1 Tax=Gryllotalpicola protaetiae TaxID=2419771 RepID=A0A387BNM1_9MICO|nr:hypothetical protein [Gryllotalpicola protaetiae]AYG04308.1 hypothetical protein D7I44_12750 [Gryllotalpicola protaetiae]
MRFDLLFDDLEAQLEAQLVTENTQQRGEEERLRAARTSLRERLAALVATGERSIRLRLLDGSAVDLTLATVGRDWLAAELAGGSECVVPLGAIASVSLSAAQLQASRGRMPEQKPGAAEALTGKIGIGVVLRDLARRRVPVDVADRAQPAPVHGTIDRVGADHLDLAVHERGAVRRESSVLERRVVALGAITMLRL